MKKLIATLLLLPMCLSACTSKPEDFLLTTPTPGPSESAVAPTSTPGGDGKETDVAPTPTSDGDGEETDGPVLRVLSMEYAIDPAFSYDKEIFMHAEYYREQENMGEITLEFVPISNQIMHSSNEFIDFYGSAAQYFDTIALKLLAGDSDFDMFYIDNLSYLHARAQVNGMLRKEYFVSMETLGLADLFDGMLPGVKNLCTADGATLLAPITFQFSGNLARQLSLQKLGITAGDVPGTAVAFTDFLLGMKAQMEDEKIAYTKDWPIAYFINQYEEQYVNEYMTFGGNTQAMWDALVYAVDGLCTSGLLDSTLGEAISENNIVPYDFPVIYYTDTLLAYNTSFFDGGIYHDELHEQDGTAPLPYVRLTEDAKESIQGGVFLAVNPASENLDLVQEYLSVLLSKDFHKYITDKNGVGNNRMNDHWNIYENPALAASPSHQRYLASLQNSTRSQVDITLSGLQVKSFITFSDYLAYHNGTLTSAQWKAKVDRELEFLRDE